MLSGMVISEYMDYWSGINVGDQSMDVEWCQEMIGQPMTGVWTIEDEDAYLAWLEPDHYSTWHNLSFIFPKNWYNRFYSGGV
jgi:hypothetical protein